MCVILRNAELVPLEPSKSARRRLGRWDYGSDSCGGATCHRWEPGGGKVRTERGRRHENVEAPWSVGGHTHALTRSAH